MPVLPGVWIAGPDATGADRPRAIGDRTTPGDDPAKRNPGCFLTVMGLLIMVIVVGIVVASLIDGRVSG